jgi:Carbohydrate esterase, sialic acid-specific acetylesterase
MKRRIAPTGVPVPPPPRPYLIVPVLGQSNAQGMGLGLNTAGPDKPHPDVHQLAMCGRSKGKIIQAVDPLLHDVPGRGAGFGVAFGKYLAEETGRSVLLVPVARGDTSFAPKNGWTWDQFNSTCRRNLFRRAIEAIDEALARNPDSQIPVLLWHQGESDVPLTPGPTYQAHLDALIDSLRARYGADIPFVLGGMVPEEMERGHRDYPIINAVHVDTPNRRPRTAFVAGPRNHLNSDTDRHYSAAGQHKLAKRMWDAYRALAVDELKGYAAQSA